MASVQITQPPGDGNALGRIRFNFPNRFSVYQHDTPDKHLFGQDFRAYSHGCMRVQDPAKYAEVLLNIARPHERWTAERIKKHVRRRRAGHSVAADSDLGSPDLSNSLCRQHSANCKFDVMSTISTAVRLRQSRANAAPWNRERSASVYPELASLSPLVPPALPLSRQCELVPVV